ncbi:hypothetical protein [Lacinutrix sp. Hel_I_90]|uniref:hypothetical protein n=1 Tax=Lacinutrix sp. Hel_I_90 TaxID=1249999 RepID=UPI0005CB457E|nr:hypothetical protein [Lacinutrix sp. Hel_I_90]
MEHEKIKKRLLEIKDINDDRQSKYFSWLKNIITISVGLIGILVSLKPDKFNAEIDAIYFVITISTLALGIFSGAILLYSEMHILDKYRQKKQEYLQKLMDDEHSIIELEWIYRPKIYNIIEFLCFGGFAVSLVSLVIYSIVSSF